MDSQKIFITIKEKIDFYKDLRMCFIDKQAYYQNIGFYIMALTHIRHKKYDFDEIEISHKSNSIYLYKNDKQIKRISDHYNGYGMMNENYMERQGIIIKCPLNENDRE